MPTHPPEVGETLQGACRPARRTWRDWPPGSDWTDWRDWCARILWTLRAAGTAWITWKPGANWPDWADRPLWPARTYRPDGTIGDREPSSNDADHDEQLHSPTPKG